MSFFDDFSKIPFSNILINRVKPGEVTVTDFSCTQKDFNNEGSYEMSFNYKDFCYPKCLSEDSNAKIVIKYHYQPDYDLELKSRDGEVICNNKLWCGIASAMCENDDGYDSHPYGHFKIEGINITVPLEDGTKDFLVNDSACHYLFIRGDKGYPMCKIDMVDLGFNLILFTDD